jgi:hypothetical protein
LTPSVFIRKENPPPTTHVSNSGDTSSPPPPLRSNLADERGGAPRGQKVAAAQFDGARVHRSTVGDAPSNSLLASRQRGGASHRAAPDDRAGSDGRVGGFNLLDGKIYRGDLDAVQDLVESSSRRGANVASWSSTFQRRLDLLRLICHHHHRHQGHPTSWRCPWSVEAPSRPFGTSRAPGILGS